MLAPWRLAVILSLSFCSAVFGASLGDLNKDGRVDRSDVDTLRDFVQSGDVDVMTSSGQKVFLVGDVDLNGDLNNRDLDLLSHYVKRQESDKWAADTRLLGMLMGLVKATGRELSRTISECKSLPTEERSKLSELLNKYVSRHGGSRKPQSGQPGSGLTILPRDGAFLACLTLCVAEATELQEAVEGRSLAPNVIRRRLRRADEMVRKLRDLATRGENIKSDTASQLRVGLSDLAAILDELAREVPKQLAIVTKKPTETPADSPDETPIPTKGGSTSKPSSSSSSSLLLFGLGLGIPLAVTVIYVVHSKGQEKPVPKMVSAKPSKGRRPIGRQVKKVAKAGARSQAETKKLEVGKLLASAKNGGISPIEEQLREVLPERYELVEMLGAGGMGVVYKALDRRLQRVVAIKAVLGGDGDDSHKRVKRFTREAETLAKLKHPGLPEIYDFLQKPMPFLAMEFIEGKTLESILSGTRVPLKQACTWTHQLFDVLAHCHNSEVLHRDIKPLNLILDRKGHVRLVDFGLAKTADQTQLTTDGAMMGTIRYMPPEMLYGNPITKQSDLYSAALVAYELIVHDYPFKSEPMPAQIMQRPIPAHEVDEKIPFELSMLLSSLLERDPSGRPSSGKAVCAQLEGILTTL